MAYRLRVCCVLRRSSDKNAPVDAIGGLTEDGSHWWLSLQQAIEGVERNRWNFYLSSGFGSETDLALAATADGSKTLVAVDSTAHPGSLAQLPECDPMTLEPKLPNKKAS